MRTLLFVLCLAATGSAIAENSSPAWLSDWNEAFKIAKEQHRLVFVDYYAAWCRPCRTMDKTVFQDPDIQREMDEFVLLRIDVDKGAVARAQRVYAYPTYVVYDSGEHERFRMVGAMPPELFTKAVDEILNEADQFFKVAELLDADRDLDAYLLLGNAYGQMGMTIDARKAYSEARKVAAKKGDQSSAQRAEALGAFTYCREAHPERAIRLLKRLAEKPEDRETEAFLWLSLGNAYLVARDIKSAGAAYEKVQSIASPDSATFKEAGGAIAKIH